jgi:hypothetical protein
MKMQVRSKSNLCRIGILLVISHVLSQYNLIASCQACFINSSGRTRGIQRITHSSSIRSRSIKQRHDVFTSFSAIDNTQQPQPQPQRQPRRPKQPPPLFIDGPSPETKPNYEEIYGPLGPFMDKLFMIMFRSKMAEKVGIDSNLPRDDFQGLIELTTALNARFSDKVQVRNIAQDILRSLFPSWLPGSFGVMFAKPFPEFSSRMNAYATYVAGTWLMGECEINDCEIDGGGVGEQQGLLVKRCRFLEESGCASVCVNSCKIPTQQFFSEDMGLPLTMTPDYETGECQFSFGLTPTAGETLEAMDTPCLSKCPSAGGLRQWHSNRCQQMENE